MKVKELKEVIELLPDEMEVILQKDSEGNGYSMLSGADSNVVFVSLGGVYSLDWTADEACVSDEEWVEIKSMPKSLILYP